MKLNDKIKFVIINKKVILLNLKSEKFFMLEDEDDLIFFKYLREGRSLIEIIDELKRRNIDVDELISFYIKNDIILED